MHLQVFLYLSTYDKYYIIKQYKIGEHGMHTKGDINNNEYIDRCRKFFASQEFKRLTQGEDAVLPNFNTNSAEDLLQLRNYINTMHAGQHILTFDKDFKSQPLLKMQIGQALINRDEYEKRMAELPSNTERSPVTVERYRRLGNTGKARIKWR